MSLSRQAYELVAQAIQTASSTSSHQPPTSTDTDTDKDKKRSMPSSTSSPPDTILQLAADVAIPRVSVVIKDQLGECQLITSVYLLLLLQECTNDGQWSCALFS